MHIITDFIKTLIDNRSIGGAILFISLVLITIVIYLLPSIIAYIRHKKQTLAIFLLNIFAGWTGIVWLGTLIWAAIKEESDGT